MLILRAVLLPGSLKFVSMKVHADEGVTERILI
jgi:hypothetical protein